MVPLGGVKCHAKHPIVFCLFFFFLFLFSFFLVPFGGGGVKSNAKRLIDICVVFTPRVDGYVFPDSLFSTYMLRYCMEAFRRHLRAGDFVYWKPYGEKPWQTLECTASRIVPRPAEAEPVQFVFGFFRGLPF